MKRGDYVEAIQEAYSHPDAVNDEADDCKSWILAGIAWVMSANVAGAKLAVRLAWFSEVNGESPTEAHVLDKLTEAVNIMENGPSFHPSQPMPYSLGSIKKMLSALEADGTNAEKVRAAQRYIPDGLIGGKYTAIQNRQNRVKHEHAESDWRCFGCLPADQLRISPAAAGATKAEVSEDISKKQSHAFGLPLDRLRSAFP